MIHILIKEGRRGVDRKKIRKDPWRYMNLFLSFPLFKSFVMCLLIAKKSLFISLL